MGENTPTTRPQLKVCFRDLGEPSSNSKPEGLDLWVLKWGCWLWEATRCVVAQNTGKNSRLVGSYVWLTIDTLGIQVYVGKIQ